MRITHLFPGIATSILLLGQFVQPGISPAQTTFGSDAGLDLLWLNTYERLLTPSKPAAMAVDQTGNVYVTGFSYGEPNAFPFFPDWVTIKYSQSGEELWVREYDGQAQQTDFATCIAVDDAGFVYVGGGSDRGEFGLHQFTVIKYDQNGDQIWLATPPIGGRITAISVDDLGNVYATGSGADYTTIKLSPAGTLRWTTRYDGLGNFTDNPIAIGRDAAGGIYVTGRSWGDTTSYDYATIKYDTAGAELWSRTYHGEFGGGDEPVAMRVAQSGDVYITGRSFGRSERFDGFITFYYDIVTLKYDAEGALEWANRFIAPDSTGAASRDLAVDNDGNVYLAGVASGLGAVTVKYGPDGDREWVSAYVPPSIYGATRCEAIAVDPSGRVYVAAQSYFFTRSTPFFEGHNNIHLLIYDPAGELIANSEYASHVGVDDEPLDIQIDANNKINVLAFSGKGALVNGFVRESSRYLILKYQLSFPTSVEDSPMSQQPWLSRSYPNPFNPETTVWLQVPQPAEVVLKVYDILGREVKTLLNGLKPTGRYQVSWDGRDNAGRALASGTYLMRFHMGEFTSVRKLTLAK